MGSNARTGSSPVFSTLIPFAFGVGDFLVLGYGLTLTVIGAPLGVPMMTAPTANNNFVLGFGAAVGAGGSITLLDINAGLGTTSRDKPWKKW